MCFNSMSSKTEYNIFQQVLEDHINHNKDRLYKR